MRTIGRILVALRSLPEGTRFFLAAAFLSVAGVFVFISWGAVTASNFASISRVFSPAGAEDADSRRELDNPGNVFEQLKSGFRDMGSLFRGGILPDLSKNSAGGAGPGEGTTSASTLGGSEFGGNTDESALPWNTDSSSGTLGSSTPENPGVPIP